MTEKPIEEKPKTKSQILEAQIADLKKQVEALTVPIAEKLLTTSKSEDTTVHSHEESKHRSIKDVLDCPTCRKETRMILEPEIEKDLKPKIVKEVVDSLLNKSAVICRKCGSYVPRNAEKCPNCGCTEGKCF
jgi:ribosomal protein L40E